MVLDPQTNFGRTGVTSSIGSADTTISVTDASVVSDPSTGSFAVVIFDAAAGPSPSQVGSGSREIVTVTGRDTTNDTLTVTRGAEGTTATSLPDTSVVIEAATGGDFDAVDAALESVASYSGGTADHLTAQLGTSSNRQDAYVGAADAQSVATKDQPVIDVTHPDFGAVGDGVANDTTAIQSAVNFASAGDTIYIPPGTYDLGGSGSVSVAKSLSFVGAGETAVTIQNAGSIFDVDGASISVTDLSADNADSTVSVVGGTVAERFHLERCTITNMATGGVAVDGSQSQIFDRTVVRDVTVDGTSDQSLELDWDDGETMLIEGVTVLNGADRGIRAGDGGPDVVVVRDCLVDTVTSINPQTIGILTRATDVGRVEACTVRDIAPSNTATSDGIALRGTGTRVADGNTVINAGGENAAIQSKGDGTGPIIIRDNFMDAIDRDCVTIASNNDVHITDNEMQGYQASAVSSPQDSPNIWIEANEIDHSNSGNLSPILIDQGGSGSLTCRDNTATAAPVDYFVQYECGGNALSIDYIKISGNTINSVNSGSRGPLFINNASNVSVGTLHVKDNDMRTCDQWVNPGNLPTDAIDVASITGNTEVGRGTATVNLTDEAVASEVSGNLSTS
jgi:hypothetical protein